MIGDAVVVPFQKVKMKIKQKVELYPIAKVCEYSGAKIVKSYWSVRSTDGTENLFASYKEAEAFQQEHQKP